MDDDVEWDLGPDAAHYRAMAACDDRPQPAEPDPAHPETWSFDPLGPDHMRDLDIIERRKAARELDALGCCGPEPEA